MGLAIVPSAKSCRRFCESGDYILFTCLNQFCWDNVDSLSSMIVLQPPLLCKEWVSRPLCVSGNSSVLMDLHWPCDCTTQSGILSIGSVSLVLLRHFPERSWIVVAFPSFTVVKAFTSWYALLLLFFLKK